MHICFLSQEFPRPGSIYGGIGTFLSTFSKELIKGGHKVTVLGMGSVSFLEKENIGGVTVISVPRDSSKFLSWRKNFKNLYKALKEVHRDHPVDIVEGSELNFAFLKKIPRIPYVIRLHGGHHFFAEGENRPVQKWKGFQEKRSFSKVDAFIAVSEYVKEHTGNLLSFHGRPTEVINYPVPLEKFYHADPEKVDPGRLVFAGTVCEKKGIRQLIQALPKVRDKFPEVHLEVYGRDSIYAPGEKYTEYLKRTCTAEELQAVRFHGPVSHDDLPGFYEQAELCVFPSHMETQGLVAPEAMAMGKPVIFSDKGPGPETIDHGVNGWLCDPFSSESIAETIIDALSEREGFERIGLAAREKVYGKFKPEVICQKNLDFYSQLLSKG